MHIRLPGFGIDCRVGFDRISTFGAGILSRRRFSSCALLIFAGMARRLVQPETAYYSSVRAERSDKIESRGDGNRCGDGGSELSEISGNGLGHRAGPIRASMTNSARLPIVN